MSSTPFSHRARTRTVGAITAALAVTCGGFFAASASGPAATDARLADDPITLWLPFGQDFVDDITPITDRCISETGIAIQPEGFEVDYTEMQLKLAVDALAGNGPDLAMQGLNQVIAMGTADFTVPLDDLITGNQEFTPESMPFLEVGQIDGRQVIVPWSVSVPIVFVNQDLLAEAGLNPDTVPATWSEVEELAAAVTASGPERYGISFGIQEGYIPLAYLLSAGGSLIDDELRPAFTDEHAALAIEHWSRLYAEGLAFPGDQDQSREAFEQGDVAMLVFSSSAISGVTERASFEWTTHPFPAADESTPVRIPAGGNGVAMLADEDRRADAFEVLACLVSEEADLLRVETLGNLPVRAANVEASPDRFLTAPWLAAWQQADLVDRWYSFPGSDSSRLTRIFTESWIEAAQRSDDPMSVLQDAADEISDILG